MIWDQVERAGLPGVKGVWSMEFGGGRMFNVISIEQRYPGHARQALLLTAGAHAANYLGRFVVVVDDDIDPTSVHDVMWAIASRCDPEQDIDTIRRTWSGPLDPMKRPGETMNSRALIDACRPFEWIDDFPPVAEATPGEKARIREKFGHLLEKL